MHIDNLKAAVEDLGVGNDLVSIKSTLYAICSRFGIVNKLNVLLAKQGERRQALCFLRMESTEQEQKVMQYLEVKRLSGYLVVIVNLSHEFPALLVGAAQPALDLAMA